MDRPEATDPSPSPAGTGPLAPVPLAPVQPATVPPATMPRDYDSDPGRFLASASVPTEDVHTEVAARADGSFLPAADGSAGAGAALYTLYHCDDPCRPIAEARRVLRPGGLLVACAPNRNSNPELADVVPDWGQASSFDGEDAPRIVRSVFGAPGDAVQVERWDGPFVTLSAPAEAASFLRVHGMSEEAAHAAAASLDLPLALTMRGCLLYAVKAA